MKIIAIAVLALLTIACGRSKNNVMTKLLNDKKIDEDSASLVINYEHYYEDKSRDSMSDSLRYRAMLDSSAYFFGRGLAIKERLKSNEFSIDSLSKMQ